MFQQGIVGAQHLLAMPDGRYLEQGAILWKLDENLPRHQRHIPRRRHMPRSIKPVGIDEMGCMHTKPLRLGIHTLGKGRLAASDPLGESGSNIIGRLDDHHAQRIATVSFVPTGNPILEGG